MERKTKKTKKPSVAAALRLENRKLRADLAAATSRETSLQAEVKALDVRLDEARRWTVPFNSSGVLTSSGMVACALPGAVNFKPALIRSIRIENETRDATHRAMLALSNRLSSAREVQNLGGPPTCILVRSIAVIECEGEVAVWNDLRTGQRL